MEGIALTTEFIGSVIAYLGGVALLALVVSVVLLGYMAEEEASGKRIFWAESPFTEVGEAPAERVKYLRAA
ncbi:MAG: hypothetical protein NUW14_12065 [Deltaproteobacteria bacterium]|nr:hypothetical protein [Deltaproteobacteria bacterium]